MSANENDPLPTTAPWAITDVVYVSIMGPVLLAAFLEWFLFLAAFLYCLCKVFRKAEHWAAKALALVITIVITLLRLVFLPVMIVTLPLPAQITHYFPDAFDSALSWFAFYTFASLLTVPFLVCLWQVILTKIGRKRMVAGELDEKAAPKVVVVMPVYNEEPEVLIKAIDSVVVCDYPAPCLHVFLSFDGDQENETYLRTVESLGIPLTLHRFHESMDIVYKGVRVTVSKFPHGGKRKCQKQTFRLINKVYEEYLKHYDNLFVLFIDSDCILDNVCIQNFMYEMELKGGDGPERLAMTGIITSKTEKNTFLTILQDMEYIHGQLFERTVESACGSVTCLPGALTMLRVSAFRRMAKYYFSDKAEQCEDLFDFAKCHLGEDRWLTHLFMVGAKHRYQVQMCTTSFCKTEAVQTFKSLLKQRRRWFLGYITNEACMLTDYRLWRMYPFLCIVRLAQTTIRTTALLFFIMVLSVVSTEQKLANLPVGFVAISLGLNWAMMFYFGIKLGRLKIWLYPIMFVFNPFFNWMYMVYGIVTAGNRTWGGPRADAGVANAQVSPQQVIEHALATGNELNVVPETFQPATLLRHPTRRVGVPLQPTGHVKGRFVPAAPAPNGGFVNRNDSGLTFPNMMPRRHLTNDAPAPTTDDGLPLPVVSPGPRSSWYSDLSDSDDERIYTPRRVSSILNEQALSSGLVIETPPSTHHITHTDHPILYGSPPRPPPRRSSRGAVSSVPNSRRSTWHGPSSGSLLLSSTMDLESEALSPRAAQADLVEPVNPYARWRTSRPSPLSQFPTIVPDDEEIGAAPLPPSLLARDEETSRARVESGSMRSGRKKLQKKRMSME